LLADVPEQVLLDIPRVIRQETTQALAAHVDLEPGLRRDNFPFERLLRVGHSLAGLGDKHRRVGLSASVEPNVSRNAHHVELRIGRILILACAVESSRSIPREALYRRSLLSNPQMGLGGAFGNPEVPPGPELVAVVLYGPSSDYPTGAVAPGPGFVTVRFPYSDWSGYSGERVELLPRLLDYEKGRAPNWSVEPWASEEQA